jgi:FkbM family methyltransferase
VFQVDDLAGVSGLEDRVKALRHHEVLICASENGFWPYFPVAVDLMLRAHWYLERFGVSGVFVLGEEEDSLGYLAHHLGHVPPHVLAHGGRLDTLMPKYYGSTWVVPYDPTGSIKADLRASVGRDAHLLDLSLEIGWHFADFTWPLPPERGLLDRLTQLNHRLSDGDDSRPTLRKIALARFAQDPGVLAASPYEQYMHPRLLQFIRDSPPGVLIDGGCTSGAEMKAYGDLAPGAFTQMHGFDLEAEEVADEHEGFFIHRQALADSPGMAAIIGDGLSGRLADAGAEGTQNTEVTTVDEFMKARDFGQGDRVKLIRLDVEGSEAAAIAGAAAQIRRGTVALVVCLYHRPLDLFELPELIADLGVPFDMFLGHHNENCLYETVLYCIPRAAE